MNLSDFFQRSFNIKIFKLNRIKYEQLWDDALTYVKKKYNDLNITFNSSSPFAQLLSVILHLGRMILYYIEDSITGLNIRTAWRPDQIRGLARLTGHDPGRSISARGSVKLTYNPSKTEYDGQVLYIPNKTAVTNNWSGLSYVLLFNADNAKITLKAGNYINASLMQGTIKYQQATGNGTEFQSFNFAERNYSTIDQYYINIYVNGERWEQVDSLLDMTPNEHACMVKTGQTGGLDVFFGNGDFGSVVPSGATVLCEYLVTSGSNGNMNKEFMNGTGGSYWSFKDPGYLSDGTEVKLDPLFTLTNNTDLIFGADYEDIVLTQEIAPYSSRSMVLANATNYKYFFKKLNMFSVIDVIQGFNTYEDKEAETIYTKAQARYYYFKEQYEQQKALFGDDAEIVIQMANEAKDALKKLRSASVTLRNAQMDDNTVYLFLIPNIKTRISASSNYFTCDEKAAFSLTETEKYNILNLIDMSGESIITVENKILQPLYPRFAINISVIIWDKYNFNDIYNNIISALSDYFINNTRRDRIPQSDLISIIEGINGVDSVSLYFDADPKNKAKYGNDFNGIDEFGDVVLERTMVNSAGENIKVRDLYPLFRGGFTNENGIVYSAEQQRDTLSAVNVTLAGTSDSNASIDTANMVNR